MAPGHGVRRDGLPLARGYRLRPLGTRCPGPGLSGLWPDDAHLRSPLSPVAYPRRTGAAGLQAQPLPRPRLPRARQDQGPRARAHPRLAPDGHRLGRPLLDRAPPLLAPHGRPLDPVRVAGRLPDRAVRGRDREGHPPLPGHARGAAAGPRGAPSARRGGCGDRSSSRSTASSPRRATRPSTSCGS